MLNGRKPQSRTRLLEAFSSPSTGATFGSPPLTCHRCLSVSSNPGGVACGQLLQTATPGAWVTFPFLFLCPFIPSTSPQCIIVPLSFPLHGLFCDKTCFQETYFSTSLPVKQFLCVQGEKFAGRTGKIKGEFWRGLWGQPCFFMWPFSSIKKNQICYRRKYTIRKGRREEGREIESPPACHGCGAALWFAGQSKYISPPAAEQRSPAAFSNCVCLRPGHGRVALVSQAAPCRSALGLLVCAPLVTGSPPHPPGERRQPAGARRLGSILPGHTCLVSLGYFPTRQSSKFEPMKLMALLTLYRAKLLKFLGKSKAWVHKICSSLQKPNKIPSLLLSTLSMIYV